MFSRTKRLWWIVCCSAPLACSQGESQPWSEARIIERFQTQSVQARELRARVAVTEAESRTRTVYPNPTLSWSREGAGYNQFFEASQLLPLNGRIRYLRDAGAAAVSAADAGREATLWAFESELRIAFYRMVSAQERLKAMATAIAEVERLVQLLRKREDEGEGSRYDRLRAERELFELRTDLAATRPLAASAGARIAAYLPEGTEVHEVQGELAVGTDVPELDALLRRATAARADLRTERKTLTRFQIEEQAARRLRIPEPTVMAGLKRADTISGVPPTPFSDITRTGLTVGVNIPLNVFNNGRFEVALQQAEQQRVSARIAVLERQIRAEVQGAREVLIMRRDALNAYQAEMASAGAELTGITQLAYEEGELGILELLDSLRVNRAARLRTVELQAAVREAWIDMETAAGEKLSGPGGRQ